MKSKTIKPNTNGNKKTKSDTSKASWDEYRDTFTSQTKTRKIEAVAEELIQWAKTDEEAFMISQFFTFSGIPSKTFYRWVESNERFKEAHATAMLYISHRREMLLIQKDPSSLRYVMPQYSDVWMKEDNRRHDQKQSLNSDADKTKDIRVIIDNYGDNNENTSKD